MATRKKQTAVETTGRNWLLLGLLTIPLGFAFVTFAVLWNQRGGDNAAIESTTSIQIEAQALARYSAAASQGNLDAFDELSRTRANLASRVDKLSGPNGYPQRDEVAVPMAALVAAWATASAEADRILSLRDVVLDATAAGVEARRKLLPLVSAIDSLAVRSGDRNGSAQTATRLADRILRQLGELLYGVTGIASNANTISTDAAAFGVALGNVPTSGDNRLIEADATWASLEPAVQRAGKAAAQLAAARGAAAVIVSESQVLQQRAATLAESIDALATNRPWPNALSAGIAALAALAVLLVLVFNLLRGQQRRYKASTQLNLRNQEAILRLLDEMGSLAEGDLTVQATVTEDITGAIADSVNFAIEALRSLVTTINETAVQVSAAANETQATAVSLAEAAEHQARQINASSTAVNDIAGSIDRVSANSAESADVAQRSVVIAAKGALMVRQTIEGMDSIRDQIQETAKRIKRLGESSQEIGTIVELINDIAEQTNILALNAAIQAASAGEAGRGFAVVADEVQHLAERASNATRRIETLVQTIQSDTNEAVSSMEQTTAEVVSGARMAEDAGLALGEIENVSTDLSGLIQRISAAARQQATAASNISETMSTIREITRQTSTGASQTAESIGNLAQLSAGLRRSVADFKLPA
ncbi:MAG: methyl-accepting chemotaxis protein [Dokdonella sp.]